MRRALLLELLSCAVAVPVRAEKVTIDDDTFFNIGALLQPQFTVTENGAPGKVVTMEKQSLPIKLTIGVDNGSGSEQVLGFYREGLNGLLEALPPD